jgi:hypothetical protein
MTATKRRQHGGRSSEHWEAMPVGYLILETQEFIVFLDKEGDVDWGTTDDYDAANERKKEQAAIHNRVQQLHGADGGQLSDRNTRRFRCMLGEGTARALEGHIDEANDVLDKAAAFVAARTRAAGRYAYFLADAASLGVALALTVGTWALRGPLGRVLGQGFVDLVAASGAGATGAFFSMLLQMRNAPVDSASERRQQYADAGARIFMGMIGAVVVALCVRSGIVLPQLKPALAGAGGHAGLLLICMVAGASERLAPALINRLANEHDADPPKIPAGPGGTTQT